MPQNFSASQLRAARGLLDWSRAQLAEISGVSEPTIQRMETGGTTPHGKSVSSIIRAFEENGVEFMDDGGVRFRPEGIQIFEGRDGLIALMEDIYDTCRRGVAGDIVLAGAPEDEFQKILGAYDETYLANMSSIPGLKMRTLIKEGDTNVVSSSYSEYRWAPKEQFQAVPFYAYADKLAIIVFQTDPAPRIFRIQSKIISQAYRGQFESMWIQAKPVPPSKTT
jgi:transcriptional regulator with XRE-family HTH domain